MNIATMTSFGDVKKNVCEICKADLINFDLNHLHRTEGFNF